MDKLLEVLSKKNFPLEVKRVILALFDSAVNFWGNDKIDLIIKTIEEFEIYCINDLDSCLKSNKIKNKTPGLCINYPIISNGKIESIKKVILLEEQEREEETAFLIAHELFFHGVKSMIQPKLKNNILMVGLEEKKYSILDGETVDFEMINNGVGLEELSTFYGQYRLMLDTYGKVIDVDPALLNISISLGKIFENTEFGKLILNAQVSKDDCVLVKYFNDIMSKSKEIDNKNLILSWSEYCSLMDKFITSYYALCSVEEESSTYKFLSAMYINLYERLLNINSQIFVASTMIDLEKYAKRRVLLYSS